MKVLLLPGIDGTGLLFEKLINEFPSNLDYEVVSYNDIEALSFSEQAIEIAELYNSDEIFIVAESYSGRVAYELFQILGEQVKGIVFLASFISLPSPFAKLSCRMPVTLLAPNIISKYLLNLLGFGSSASQDLVDSVFHSISQANKSKLKSRFQNIVKLEQAHQGITCPVIYMRPANDLIVNKNAVTHLASICSNYRQIDVDGGHFVALTHPKLCCKVICDAVNI